MKRAVVVSARFLIIGALSTVIELAVFNLLYLLWGMDPVWAKIVSSLVALINAYFGNREWAFKNRGRRGRGSEIALFLAVNLLCTLLGAGIVALGMWMLGTWTLGSGALIVNVINLFSIAVVVLVRFALYHSVVFRGARPPVQIAPAEQARAAAGK